jgi:microcystin-dependent protein
MYLTTTSGIQSNTIIVNTSLNSITMNKNATATVTNATIKILPFGSAASSSNFKIPDLRSRIPVGNIGNGSSSNDKVMGVTNGSENITLGIGEITSHSHGIQSETPHNHSGNSEYESNTHYHPSYMKVTSQEAGGYGLTAVAGFQNRVIVSGNPYDYPGAYQASAQHYHSFTTATGYTNINVQSAGSGGSHNNMHPYLPLNYIIKY